MQDLSMTLDKNNINPIDVIESNKINNRNLVYKYYETYKNENFLSTINDINSLNTSSTLSATTDSINSLNDHNNNIDINEYNINDIDTKNQLLLTNNNNIKNIKKDYSWFPGLHQDSTTIIYMPPKRGWVAND